MYRLYQARYKNDFLESVTTKETYEWLFNKLFDYEAKWGKDLYDFNKGQILEFYKDLENSTSTLQTYTSMISTYMNWAIKNNLSKVSENVAANIKVNELKKVAKPDPSVIHVDVIYELVGKKLEGEQRESSGLPRLKNAQDKLLIYLIFLGLGGKQAKEIRQLKVEHIDRVKKVIKLSKLNPDRSDVLIDDFAIDLIDAALAEQEYMRYIDDTMDADNVREDYEINEGHGYIFRKSNLGKQRETPYMSYQGILARLSTLSKYTGIKLTLNRIKKSGMAYVVKLLKEAGVKIEGRGFVGNPVIQRSLFDRFDIVEEQRKLKVINEARKHIKEVYNIE